MSIPSDLSGQVSPALAAVVRRVLNDPDRDEDATLGSVRQAISKGLVGRMVAAGELDEMQRGTLAEEIDELIEAVGENVAAVHLLAERAPWPLAGVFEALLERRDDPERPATLLDVREAIDGGLLNDLLADGSIDSDEDDAVLPQLAILIKAHGEHALVEDLLSPEDESQ